MVSRTSEPGFHERVFCRAQLGEGVWIAPGAAVFGDVEIGDRSGIWFAAVVRGDSDPIRIGSETNLQDGCVVHSDPGCPTTIGDRVTVGHAALIHGATIEDDVLIGMRATLLNDVHIGRGSVVAAGSLLTEGTVVPEGSIVMGSPAKVRGSVQDKHREMIDRGWRHYADLAAAYREHFDAKTLSSLTI